MRGTERLLLIFLYAVGVGVLVGWLASVSPAIAGTVAGIAAAAVLIDITFRLNK